MCFLAEEKLKWAFKLYDVDCSGTITQDEMILIFEKLCRFSFSKTLFRGNESRNHNYQSYQISFRIAGGPMPKEETKERKSSVDGKSAEGKEKKEGKGKFTKTAAAANNVRCRSLDTLSRCKMQNIPFSTDKQCSHDVQEKGEEPAEGDDFKVCFFYP